MSEYRTTATLTAEGTFVVPGPRDLPAGTRAEVTVRVEEESLAAPPQGTTFEEFFQWLEAQPPRPAGALEAERVALRELRNDWDRIWDGD